MTEKIADLAAVAARYACYASALVVLLATWGLAVGLLRPVLR